MERNEQGSPNKSDFRACLKIRKFCQEVRKIPEFSGKSKIKNCLFGMFSSRPYKKTGKLTFLNIFGKINVLASPRQCDFIFSKKKSKTII